MKYLKRTILIIIFLTIIFPIFIFGCLLELIGELGKKITDFANYFAKQLSISVYGKRKK